MAEVISIINQKGGVGKTTTAINLSFALSLFDKKCLIIDLDPQSNATSGFGVSTQVSSQKNSYLTLIGEKDLDESLVKLKDNLFILPSSFHLSGAESELYSFEEREFFLKKAIENSAHDFDYILIDCPPTLGLLTLNSLCASQSFLIPLQCEYFALEGLSQLLHTVSLVKKKLNPSLEMKGIVLTMFDKRNNLSHQVAQEVALHFKDNLFKTSIPRNVKLSEAPSYGKSIFEYENSSKGALNYLKLTKEFLDIKGETGVRENQI